jgi:hypothetical protein
VFYPIRTKAAGEVAYASSESAEASVLSPNAVLISGVNGNGDYYFISYNGTYLVHPSDVTEFKLMTGSDIWVDLE